MRLLTLVGWLLCLSQITGMCLAAEGYELFDGDGSSEPGFVSPKLGKQIPKERRNISSSETQCPLPPIPDTPQAHSEKKKPPRPPVLFTKLTSPHGKEDWDARPRDLRNLLRSMRRMIEVNYSSEVKNLDDVDTDPTRNPILYRSGHYHFSFTPEQRKRLREFCLNGGMIILNAGMGSRPFFESAKREMKALFPEIPVRPLGRDHALFRSYYDLKNLEYRPGVLKSQYFTKDPPWLGVTINCRTVIAVSRWGMAIGWDTLPGDELLGYTTQSAKELGINLMAYATAHRVWTKNMARAIEFIDKTEPIPGEMAIAQIKHAGEWKTRHAGLSMLLYQFNQKTEIPVKFERRNLTLVDDAIFNSPLLYMTGHEAFSLSDAERAQLRRYLENGGTLFGEACCGRKAFDLAFRREIELVLPGKGLKPIPTDDGLYKHPNRIVKVIPTPALAAQRDNHATMPPELLGISLNNHYAVIYSPYGLAAGWEMAQSPYAFGYASKDALRIGENILMYAILP